MSILSVCIVTTIYPRLALMSSIHVYINIIRLLIPQIFWKNVLCFLMCATFCVRICVFIYWPWLERIQIISNMLRNVYSFLLPLVPSDTISNCLSIVLQERQCVKPADGHRYMTLSHGQFQLYNFHFFTVGTVYLDTIKVFYLPTDAQ